jgi:hypothetical protein
MTAGPSFQRPFGFSDMHPIGNLVAVAAKRPVSTKVYISTCLIAPGDATIP